MCVCVCVFVCDLQISNNYLLTSCGLMTVLSISFLFLSSLESVQFFFSDHQQIEVVMKVKHDGINNGNLAIREINTK